MPIKNGEIIEDYTGYVIKIRNDVFMDITQNAKGSLRFAMSEFNKNYNIKEFKIIKNYNTGRYEIFFETLENDEKITFEKMLNDYIYKMNDRAGMKFVVDYIEQTQKDPEEQKDNYEGIVPRNFDLTKINSILKLLIVLIFGFYILKYIDVIFDMFD